ncbi:inhibitor of growth protein 4-like isoform X5 [Acipenser ruthenus]|uniref:inhibitor of growth protein 4-like isoform X5 n=1 Tax=Acipenser ruthenus TaxID=7906 RepID=UPI00274183E8|nr:inhibitor of growth protein 4-like isoform X5 [Acipenser ruthenus]
MAAGMYLEHYLDSIENLPFELQRNFQLMRDLDQRTEGLEFQRGITGIAHFPSCFCISATFSAGKSSRDILRHSDLKGEIDGLATEYTANARTLSSEQKLSLLRQIQESYTKCKEFGDDKVQLAMQTYEMVDKHIRRLDTDLARFEADLKEKQIESTDYDSSSSKGKKSESERKKASELQHVKYSSELVMSATPEVRGQKDKKVARTRSKVKNSDDDSSPKNGQKKLKLHSTEYSAPAVTFGNVHPSDVLDMPVDPNEPTYCLCHQVSYGEMIGCDNPDCSIEWFHFACVGLTTKPRGKWYCPRCTQDRKKK